MVTPRVLSVKLAETELRSRKWPRPETVSADGCVQGEIMRNGARSRRVRAAMVGAGIPTPASGAGQSTNVNVLAESKYVGGEHLFQAGANGRELLRAQRALRDKDGVLPREIQQQE